MKKLYIVGIIVLFVLFVTIIINGKISKSLNIKEALQNSTQQPEGERMQTAQPTEEWNTFTNTRFSYSFEHPMSLKREALDGRGADFSSDVDSIVTFMTDTSGVFNVTRLYLDEQSIKSGISANVEQMRSEKYSETYIKDYSERMDREFADIRKYRDIPFEKFALLVQKALTPDMGLNTQGEPLQKVIVDGLPAYQFTRIDGGQLNAEAVPLKMEYGFWSSFGTHRFIFLESPSGEKYYIHYKPGDPISERIFKSFHFMR